MISRFSTSLQFYPDTKTARRVAALLGRYESRPSSAHTSVPEAGTACTWLKSNKGIGGPRDSPEENGARQSCRDQESRWFTLRISNKTLAVHVTRAIINRFTFSCLRKIRLCDLTTRVLCTIPEDKRARSFNVQVAKLIVNK